MSWSCDFRGNIQSTMSEFSRECPDRYGRCPIGVHFELIKLEVEHVMFDNKEISYICFSNACPLFSSFVSFVSGFWENQFWWGWKIGKLFTRWGVTASFLILEKNHTTVWTNVHHKNTSHLSRLVSLIWRGTAKTCWWIPTSIAVSILPRLTCK